MDTTETQTHAEHHVEEHHATGRRPMSGANWVGLILLLGAIAFYLFFAVPEFIGIVSGPPLVVG